MKSIVIIILSLIPIACLSQRQDVITLDTMIEKLGEEYKYRITVYRKGIKIKEVYQTKLNKEMMHTEFIRQRSRGNMRRDSVKYFENGKLAFEYKPKRDYKRDTIIKRDTTIEKIGQQYKYCITEYRYGIKFRELYQTRGSSGLSLEDMFMRGIKPNTNSGEYLMRRDSIKEYFENGNLRYKHDYGKNLRQTPNYDLKGKLSYTEITKNGKQSYSFGKNRHLTINTLQISVDQKYGDPIHEPVLLSSCKPPKTNIYVSCNDSNVITTPQELQIDTGKTQEILVSVKDNSKEIDATIFLHTDNNERFPIGLKVIRYDLDDSDFHPTKTIALKNLYSLSNNKLKLRLNSNAKLAILYKKNKLIRRIPISKIETKIDLSNLKKGLYLIEIQDLGTMESKYCQIKKE